MTIALFGCAPSSGPDGAIGAAQRAESSPKVPARGKQNATHELVKQGVAYLREADYERAQVVFSAAVKFAPTNSIVHILNGISYHLQYLNNSPDSKALAETAYGIANSLDKSDPLPLIQLGRLHIDSGEYSRASMEFVSAYALSPSDQDALSGLMQASLLLKDFKTALWAGEQLTALDPTPEKQRVMVLMYAAAGQPAEADRQLARYEQANAKDPETIRRLKQQIRYISTQAERAAGAGGMAPAATGYYYGPTTATTAGSSKRAQYMKVAGPAYSDGSRGPQQGSPDILPGNSGGSGRSGGNSSNNFGNNNGFNPGPNSGNNGGNTGGNSGGSSSGGNGGSSGGDTSGYAGNNFGDGTAAGAGGNASTTSGGTTSSGTTSTTTSSGTGGNTTRGNTRSTQGSNNTQSTTRSGGGSGSSQAGEAAALKAMSTNSSSSSGSSTSSGSTSAPAAGGGASAGAPATTSGSGGTYTSVSTSQQKQKWFDCDTRPGLGKAPGGAYGVPVGGTAGDQTLYLEPIPAPCEKSPPPKMAMIDAVLIRTVDTQSSSYGINLLTGLQIFAGTQRSSTTTQVGNGSVTENVTASVLGIGNTASATLNGISGILSYTLNIANSTSSNSQVVARPTLTALDRIPSTFYSGSIQTVGLNGGGVSGAQVTNIPTGVSLSVTPTFVDDETMMLAVKASRSFISNTAAVGGFNAGIGVAQHAVTANVRVKYGETLVLDGLTDREYNKSQNGVPILQDIPIIQYLFNNVTRLQYAENVLVLITPRRLVGEVKDIKAVEEAELKRENGELTTKEYSIYESIKAYQNTVNKMYPNLDVAVGALDRDSAYFRQFKNALLNNDEDAWVSQPGMTRFFNDAATMLYFTR